MVHQICFLVLVICLSLSCSWAGKPKDFECSDNKCVIRQFKSVGEGKKSDSSAPSAFLEPPILKIIEDRNEEPCEYFCNYKVEDDDLGSFGSRNVLTHIISTPTNRRGSNKLVNAFFKEFKQQFKLEYVTDPEKKKEVNSLEELMVTVTSPALTRSDAWYLQIQTENPDHPYIYLVVIHHSEGVSFIQSMWNEEKNATELVSQLPGPGRSCRPVNVIRVALNQDDTVSLKLRIYKKSVCKLHGKEMKVDLTGPFVIRQNTVKLAREGHDDLLANFNGNSTI